MKSQELVVMAVKIQAMVPNRAVRTPLIPCGAELYVVVRNE